MCSIDPANDVLTDEAWLPASFQRLVDQARSTWIPLPEVARFLQRGASRAVEIIHESVGPVGPPVRPEPGALFIVDERRLSNWREDGYTYLTVPTDIRLRTPAGIQYSDGSVYGSRSSTLTAGGSGSTAALGASYILGTKPVVIQPLVSDMVTVTFLQPHKKSLSVGGGAQTPSSGASQLLGGGDFAEQTLVVEWSSVDASASNGPRGEPSRFLQRRALRLPRVASTSAVSSGSDVLSMSALGGGGNNNTTEGAGWIWLVQYLEDNASPHYTPNGIPIESKSMPTRTSLSNLPASLPPLDNSGSPKRSQSELTTNFATKARTRLEEEIANGLAELNKDMRYSSHSGSASQPPKIVSNGPSSSSKSSSLPDDGEIYAALYGSSADTSFSGVSNSQKKDTLGMSPPHVIKSTSLGSTKTYSTDHINSVTASSAALPNPSSVLQQPWQPKVMPTQKGPYLPSHPVPHHHLSGEKLPTSDAHASHLAATATEDLKAKRIALAQKLNSGNKSPRPPASTTVLMAEAVEYMPNEPQRQELLSDADIQRERASMPSKSSNRFPLEDLRESYLAASRVPLPYDDDSDDERDALVQDDIRELETMGESALGRSTLDEEYDGSGREGLGPVDDVNEDGKLRRSTNNDEEYGTKGIKYSELFDAAQQEPQELQQKQQKQHQQQPMRQPRQGELTEPEDVPFDGRGSYAAIHAEERKSRSSVHVTSSRAQIEQPSRARISHASTNVYRFGHTLLGDQDEDGELEDELEERVSRPPPPRRSTGSYRVRADPSAEYSYVGTHSGDAYFGPDDLEVEGDHIDEAIPQSQHIRGRRPHTETETGRKVRREPGNPRPRSRSGGGGSIKKKKKKSSSSHNAGDYYMQQPWGLGGLMPGMPSGLPPQMQLAIQQMAQQQAFLAQAQAAQQQVRPPPPQAALSSLQFEAQQILEAQAAQARARMYGGGGTGFNAAAFQPSTQNTAWAGSSSTMAPQFRSYPQQQFYQQPPPLPPVQPPPQSHARVSFADESGPYGPPASSANNGEDVGPYGPVRNQNGAALTTDEFNSARPSEGASRDVYVSEPSRDPQASGASNSPVVSTLDSSTRPAQSTEDRPSFQQSSPPLPAQRLRKPVLDEDLASAAAMSIGLEEAAAERGEEGTSLAAAAAAAAAKKKAKKKTGTSEAVAEVSSQGRKFATNVIGSVTLDDGSPFTAVSTKLSAMLIGWRVRAAMRLKKVLILRQRIRDSRRLLDELTSSASKGLADDQAANENFIRSIKTQLETEVTELKKLFSPEDGGLRAIDEISSFIRAQLRLLKGKKPTGPLIPFAGSEGAVADGDAEAAARGAKRAAERKQRLVGGALGKSVMAKYSVIPGKGNSSENDGGAGGGDDGGGGGGGLMSPAAKPVEKPWLKPRTAKNAEKSSEEEDGAASIEEDVTVVEAPKRVRNSLMSPQKENILSSSSVGGGGGGGGDKVLKDEDDESFGLNSGLSGKWRVVVEVVSAKALAPAFYAPGTLAAGPGLKASAPLDDAALAPDPEAREAFVVAYLARHIDAASSGKVKVSGKKLETGVASKTLNPVWKKRFVFSLPLRSGLRDLHEGGVLPTDHDELLRIAESDLSPLSNWEVRLEVLDSDRYVRDTFMGGVIIPLSDLQSLISREQDEHHHLSTLSKWVPLQAFSPGDRVRGQLQLRMRLLAPDSDLRFKLFRSEADAAAGLVNGAETESTANKPPNSSAVSSTEAGGFLRRKSVNPKPKKVDWSGVLPKTHSQPSEHVFSSSSSGGGGGTHHASAPKPMYKVPDYSKVRGKVVSQTPSEPARSSSSTVKRKDLSSKGKAGQGGYTRFVTYSATIDEENFEAPPPPPPQPPHRASSSSTSQPRGSILKSSNASGQPSRQPTIDKSGAVEYMGGGSWTVPGDLWMTSQIEQTATTATSNSASANAVLLASKIPVARKPASSSLPVSNLVSSPRAPLPASPLFNLGSVSGGDAMESVGVAIDRFFQMTAAESSAPVSIPAQGSFSSKIRSSSYSDTDPTSSAALNPELHKLVYGPKTVVNDVNDAAKLADELKQIRMEANRNVTAFDYASTLQASKAPKPGGFARYSEAARLLK